MSNQLLLSKVPTKIYSKVSDPTTFAYRVMWMDRKLMEAGIRPYSASDVFRSVLDGGPIGRYDEAHCFLVLGECVSETVYDMWESCLRDHPTKEVVRLTLAMASDLELESFTDGLSLRPAEIIPRVFLELRDLENNTQEGRESL